MMVATVAPAYTPPHMVTTMDKNRKRKPDRVRLQKTKNLTVLGDSPDIYDVPDSPQCVKRAKNGSRRPWNLSQNTPEDTIRVSTPDRLAQPNYRNEPSLPSTQRARLRKQPTMITHIQEALKTGPRGNLNIDGIFDWFRTNQSTMLEQRGPIGLRKYLQTTLNQQSSKKKPKIWCDKDGSWRCYEDSFTKPNEEENTETKEVGHGYTSLSLVHSSTGGQTSDGTPELYEGIPRPKPQETRDGNHESGQDNHPITSLQTEFEYAPTSIDSRPQASAQEMHANVENETLQLRAATLSARASDEQASNNGDTPIQQSDPPAEISSTIHNDNPSGIEQGRVPVDLCYGPEQAKSINTPTPLKKVQDDLKPLVKEHIPFQTPGITTEEIYQHVMANSAQATKRSNPETLKAHIRTILKHMYDSGEARREAAKGDHGGSTFVYTLLPSFQTEPSPLIYTPSMRSSLTTSTHAHQDPAQSVSGHPANLRHLLWQPEEGLLSATTAAGARESTGNDDGAQDVNQPGASDQSLAEPEPTIRASDRSGYELPQAQNGTVIGGGDPDKADKELLETARCLRAEMELATNDLSMSEFQMQQAQSKCLTLERQASEQRSKEVELLTRAQCLREELVKIESDAAECQKDADRVEKEADDERNSSKEHERIIAATKERVTKIERKRQEIRDELKV
jgi:hypothetical protein